MCVRVWHAGRSGAVSSSMQGPQEGEATGSSARAAEEALVPRPHSQTGEATFFLKEGRFLLHPLKGRAEVLAWGSHTLAQRPDGWPLWGQPCAASGHLGTPGVNSEGPRESLRSQELASCREHRRQGIYLLVNKEAPGVLVRSGSHQHQRGRNTLQIVSK